MENFEQYHLRIVPLSEYSGSNGSGLLEDWRILEESAHTTFFLSWSWIASWLESYAPDADVLCVRYNNELVGLSLLCKSTFSGWKRFTSRRLHINQTGNSELDQIWTEYNGILCSSAHETPVQLLLMSYLVDHYADWDELQIGAVTKTLANTLHESSDLTRLDLWHSPSYGVDLNVLRARHIDFLDSLSRNTRYQIRRSLKLYAISDAITLKFASSEEEALLFFNEIGPLHITRWGGGSGESGFANPHFISFHTSLISNAFKLKQIDLIKIQCGDRTLGYLYNFLYRGRVYFYLSGLVSENDAKLKPGLCAHSLAIQHYLDSGYCFYDLMGGNDRYKSSLGSVHEYLFQISLQKKHFKFKVESYLRKVKQRLSL